MLLIIVVIKLIEFKFCVFIVCLFWNFNQKKSHPNWMAFNKYI